MTRLGIIMSLLFVVSLLAIGATAQDRSPGDTSMLYSMMGGGGGGMMGGSRGGMMRGGGWVDRPDNSYDRYGNMPGPSEQYGNNPEFNGRYRQSHEEQIDILKRKIIEKRRELSRLYRSQNADAEVMNEKIDELNRMEQQLDDKLSGRQ